jgi:hypothetical protein
MPKKYSIANQRKRLNQFAKQQGCLQKRLKQSDEEGEDRSGMVGRGNTPEHDSFLSRQEREDCVMGVTRGCTAQEGEESVMGVGQGHTSEGEAFLSRAEGEERSSMVGRGHTSQRESFLSRREGDDGAMGVTQDCTAREGEDRAMAIGGEESTIGVGPGRAPDRESFS